MRDIKVNRFFIWLMYLVPIAITGWFSVVIWAIIQIFLCSKEIEEKREHDKPIRERKHIIEMNKPENLTKEDKEYLKKFPDKIKIAKGVYVRNDW